MTRSFVRQINVGLGVALSMLLLNAVISYRNILKLIGDERLVSQSYQAIAELEASLSLLKDAETGQRGYLLTGKERYLEPYKNSVARINQQIQTLRQLQVSPNQQKQIQALERLIGQKLAELDQTIQVRRTRGLNPALQIVQSDRGKQIMDNIRRQIAAIEQQEKQQLSQRLEDTQRKFSSTLFTFTLVTATSLVLLGLVALTLWQNEVQRRQAEQTLKEREERLQLFVEYAPVCLAMFDRNMRYLAVSQRWVDVYHLGSIESTLGQSHYELFPNLPEHWRQAHQQGLTGQSKKCEEDHFFLPDGTEQYLQWEVQPWFNDGIVQGILLFVEDITARKMIESALRESDQQFKATFNQAAVGIAHVAPDGSWLRVNEKLCQIIGYTEEELLQLTFQDITYPDDLDKDLNYVRQMLAGEIQTYAMEKRYIRQNSSLVWINLTVSLVRGDEQPEYFISVIEDVSDRKLAEADLQQYKDIFQFAEHGLAISRGAILEQVNPTFAQLHGYAVEELIGCPILDFYPPEMHEDAIQVVQQLDQAKHLTHETIHLRKDGSVFPVLLDITVVQEEPDSAYRIVNLFDITERKQTETALQQSNLTLERRVSERTAQLQEINQELESFTYSVSHDLRAPLRIMQGFAQALQEDYSTQLDDIAQSYIESIAASAVQMDQLINDLLSYSRLSRTQIELSPIDLNHVVEIALQQLETEIQERQVIVAIAPNLPTVMAHRSILVQVIVNLIGNAIKFVAPSVRPQVLVFAQMEPNQVYLWIVDNGIGIAPEHQKRIFRVFERLHGVDTYPGTGIGLAIVQKGIERMGGQVGVESEIGSGSRFWIALPLVPPATTDSETRISPA